MGAKWIASLVRFLLFCLLCLSAAIGRADDSQAERLFTVAAKFFQQEQWDFAAEEFEAFLEKYPQSEFVPEAKYFLARCQIKQKNADAGKTILRELIDSDANNEWGQKARILLAELEYQAKAYRAVIELLKDFEHIEHPEAPTLLMLLGSSYQALGDYPQAQAIYQQILCLWPSGETTEQALYNYLLCAAERNDLETANHLIAAWPGILQARSTQLPPSVIYARLLLKGKKYQRVLDVLQATNDAGALYLRALAHRGLEQDQEELATFRQIVLQGTESNYYAPAALAIIAHQREQQQPAAALPLYETLVTQYPQFVERNSELPAWEELLFDYATAALQAEKLDLATSNFAQVYRLRGKLFAEAGYELARLHYQQGNLDDALSVLSELGEVEPASQLQSEVLYLRATIQMQRENWPAAQKDLTRYLEVTPVEQILPQAPLWLAECYLQTDHTARGMDTLQGIVEGPQANPQVVAQALLRSAQIQLSLQNYSQAEEFLIQRRTRFADAEQNDEMYYILGRCAAHQAKFEQARRYYRQAVASSKNEDLAARAQWMIGEAFFHQQDYLQACRAYHQVALRYRHPTWTAAALLQAGKCHELLGEPAYALRCYQQLEHSGQTQFHQEGRKRLALLQTRLKK